MYACGGGWGGEGAVEALELRFLVDGGLAKKGASLRAGALGAQDIWSQR